MTLPLDSAQLEPIWDMLLPQLPEQRWFADKQRQPTGLRPRTIFWLRRELPAVLLALVDVDFADGGSASYQLPLGVRSGPPPVSATPQFLFAELPPADGGEAMVLLDALADSELAGVLLTALVSVAAVPGDPAGQLACRVLREGFQIEESATSARTLSLEQSNSLVVYEERLLLKVFRRLWGGVNPELQLLEALDRSGFSGIARPWLALQATIAGETHSLGMLQTYLRNGTDGFTLALTSLRDLQADLLLDADGEVPSKELCDDAVRSQGGSFTAAAREMGTLTAQMHLALASSEVEHSLRARPLDQSDLRQAQARIEHDLTALLGDPDPRLEPLRVNRARLRNMLRRVGQDKPEGLAIRVHGDLHLGQLLRTDVGWHVLDFEGRPAISVAERSAHGSPLQDVAGMLRSFDYAAAVALRQQAHPDEATARTLAPYGRSWAAIMRAEFWDAYLNEPGVPALIGPSQSFQKDLLTVLEIGQALYEVAYELRSRPEWLTIPLEGIARLVHGAAL